MQNNTINIYLTCTNHSLHNFITSLNFFYNNWKHMQKQRNNEYPHTHEQALKKFSICHNCFKYIFRKKQKHLTYCWSPYSSESTCLLASFPSAEGASTQRFVYIILMNDSPVYTYSFYYTGYIYFTISYDKYFTKYIFIKSLVIYYTLFKFYFFHPVLYFSKFFHASSPIK